MLWGHRAGAGRGWAGGQGGRGVPGGEEEGSWLYLTFPHRIKSTTKAGRMKGCSRGCARLLL